MLDALTRLKAAALELRHAIDTRDLAGFGRGLQTYWDLKKRIDPGSTNDAIERLTARVAPWSSGHVLLGAGGGGFLLILAHDETAAQRLRHRFDRMAQQSRERGSSIFRSTIKG